jgi:hypothetical protein
MKFVKCEYELPGANKTIQDTDFFTNDMMIGSRAPKYVIDRDGYLLSANTFYEVVSEKDRPFYGRPEWDKDIIYRTIGSLKPTEMYEQIVTYNGKLTIEHVYDRSFKYEIEFQQGQVIKVERKE